MKFLIGALLFLFPSLSVSSQSLEGYVVLHTGDSSFGTIFLTRKVVQVIDKDENVMSYPYSEINYAKVGSKEGRVFSGRMMYYNDALETDNVSKASSDTILLAREIFSTPKMTLYDATDALGKIHYLVARPGDEFLTSLAVSYTLGSFKSTANNLNPRAQAEIKYYAGQLKMLFGNCKQISNDEYESLSYTSYALKAIIKRYNKKCK